MSFKPIPFKLAAGSESEKRLKTYLFERTQGIQRSLAKLHGLEGIVKWRKTYEAKPAEEKRSFPWEGASNLVIPLVAIHSDTLQARAMAGVFKTRPFWTARELGEWSDDAPEGIRDALETFLQYVGLEPGELDLYRVYHEWFGETFRYGLSVLKSPWVKQFEDRYGASSSLDGTQGWNRVTLYEGPRPEKLKYENFKYQVNRGRLEDMDFKYDVVQLDRFDLEERSARGVYDAAAVTSVLKLPDRVGGSPVNQVQGQKEQDANVSSQTGYGLEEWDIDEVHLRYRVDPSHFARLIIWYHEKSRTILRSYYHYYPDEIYIAGRLFYRDDMFAGTGFAEILAPFQEEISEIHNQRRDNMTVANMKLFAVDPDSPLHKGFRIYPSAMLPARQLNGQKEIETLEFGTPVQGEIDSERLSLELAEKRSGVSPPMSGAGSGTNNKRGIYTAMGTLSVMQDSNTRTDLNVTDIRYAHTRLGRLVCREYGLFGAPDTLLERFGKMADKIKTGLEAIAQQKMALPVYASTASINREVEKQSDLMLTNVMNGYHQNITQMLQAVSGPMVSPEVKDYITKAIEASRNLMVTVLRHFDRDEVDRLAPKPKTPTASEAAGASAAGPGAAAPQAQSQPMQPGLVPPPMMPPGGNGGNGMVQ